MSKKDDALKLALEALEDTLSGDLTPYQAAKTITVIREALADSALERMAENARELGLDYEPPCKTGSQCASKCQQCEQPAQQQEPVVWMYVNRSTHETVFQKHMRSFVDHSQWKEAPLYGEPLANQEKTSGSPKPAKPEALRLAELFEVAANAAPEGDEGWLKTAAELRRMHDLLGKANALCRIRAEEIERLKAQPAQEPVAWADLNALTEQFNSVNCGTAYRLPGENRHPLYTSPPASKPWVGLTQQDIDIAFDDTQEGGSFNEFARAIEAKLREKNA